MSFWIMAEDRPATPKFYYFSKEFDAPLGASLKVRASGDTRYALYLNGTLVLEGPCQGSAYQTYFESEDLTPYLTEGKNTLIAKVMYVTDGYFISTFRKSAPAFWLDGELVDREITTKLGTDASWTCAREDACSLEQGTDCYISIPPYEHWSGDSVRTPIGVKQAYEPDFEHHCFDECGINQTYVMTPRPLPAMETEPYRPMQAVRSGAGFTEFDAINYTTAKLRLRFQAKAGSRVRVMYAECYRLTDENGKRYKGVRDAYDDPTAFLWGCYDTLVATGEEQVFEPFWYRSFRFARVECDDPDFKVAAFDYAFYHYPLDAAGVFTCSDPRYNKMWEISRNTVLCCMHEMYVDCPYYEQQQYDMDSALEMLFTLRMSADCRMPIKSITDFAHSQMPDGLLQANYPSVKMQIIPNFTLFWVLMLRDYLRYAGISAENLQLLRTMIGTVGRALDGFESHMLPSGMLGQTQYWHFVDWVPGWSSGVPGGAPDEPITVSTLMYAAALKAAAELCEILGRTGTASDYRSRAEAAIRAVYTHCYDQEVGLYRNRPSVREYSQHTTLWAILSGAVSGEEAGKLIDRTFESGVPVAFCTFSMSHYMFRALEMAGRYDTYARRQLEGWEKMLDLHCTTWCENPDSPRSECHGWSSAPIYEFSSMVLGVYPTADGYASVRIKPYTNSYDLTWAKGTVPTPHGVISVSWEKKDGKFVLDVTLPEGEGIKSCEIVLPDGQCQEQVAKTARYVCDM